MMKKSFLKTTISPKSVSHSDSSLTKPSTTVDKITESLVRTVDWSLAKGYFDSDEFADLPERMTEQFAQSFLLLGGTHGNWAGSFPLGLSKVVQFMTAEKIPVTLLPPYL
jgi:hypothetical protein